MNNSAIAADIDGVARSPAIVEATKPWAAQEPQLVGATSSTTVTKGACEGVEKSVVNFESLPLAKQLLYSVGQLGWSSLSGLVSIQLVYFYLPPKDVKTGEPFFPIFVTQANFAMVFNIIMILATCGRLWDAITDPLIASFSDRLRHPRGRRIPCLAAGAAPAALCCALLFVPIVGEESPWNVVWLAVNQTLFYLFITLYCTPYFSLVAELGHTTKERLNLSTWISVTYALGIVLASGAPAIGSAFGFDALGSLQAGVLIVCCLSSLCMYVPVMTIDERRYCSTRPSHVGVLSAIQHCLRNPHFRPYVAADFSYFFAMAIITTGLPYFLTVLVQLEADLILAIMVTIVVASFILYYPTNLVARRFGKKKPILASLLILNMLFGMIYILGMDWVPLTPRVQIFGLGLVAAFPIAVLGVLPNAVLADIAAQDALVSGESHEGMYFAARALLSKLGQSCGLMIFAGLTNFGKDVGDDLGIRLSGPVGLVFGTIAFVSFTFYQEEKVVSSCDALSRAPSQTNISPESHSRQTMQAAAMAAPPCSNEADGAEEAAPTCAEGHPKIAGAGFAKEELLATAIGSLWTQCGGSKNVPRVAPEP